MIEAILSGLILGLALVFSVGPVVFTILKLRINLGIVSAFYFISGVWISDILWVVFANFFGSLLSEVVAFKKPIGIAGGCFLIGLGLFYLFIKKYHNKVDEGLKIKNATHVKLFVTGFLINTLNPAVIALWLAAATKSMMNSYNERLATFVICLGLNMGADVFKINLAGNLKKKLTENNINLINKFSGLLFLIFGLVLLTSSFFSSSK